MKEKIEELQEMAKKLEDRRNKVLAIIEYLKKMSETKVCPLCGKEFKPKKINQIYCSSKCSKTLYEIVTRQRCIERAKKSYLKKKGK